MGPYELHDFFLYYMLRFGFGPGKIYRMACRAFAGEYDGATVKRWLTAFYRRFFTQQFKRSCLPDGPKVGSVTLSPRGIGACLRRQLAGLGAGTARSVKKPWEASKTPFPAFDK